MSYFYFEMDPNWIGTETINEPKKFEASVYNEAIAKRAVKIAACTTEFYDNGDPTPMREKYYTIHHCLRADRYEGLRQADSDMGDMNP